MLGRFFSGRDGRPDDRRDGRGQVLELAEGAVLHQSSEGRQTAGAGQGKENAPLQPVYSEQNDRIVERLRGSTGGKRSNGEDCNPNCPSG